MSVAAGGITAARDDRDPAAERSASALGSVLLGSLAAAMVAGGFGAIGFAITVALLCAWAAGAPWPRTPWFVALVWGSAVAVVLNLYLRDGRALNLPHAFGRPATLEGARDGALFALRLAGASLALHGLRAAWPGERAADELASRLRPLERLGFPLRPARAMIGLALRFAPLVASEYRRIVRLQALRAGRPPRTFAERLHRQRAVAIPALVASLEMAERVALGLEARHYRLRAIPVARGGAAAAFAGWLVFLTAALWRV